MWKGANRGPFSSIGEALAIVCRAGGRGFKPLPANTKGLKKNLGECAAYKWLSILVFLDKDEKLTVGPVSQFFHCSDSCNT